MAATQKNNLQATVKQNWLFNHSTGLHHHIEVGLSGGVDSAVLTYLLSSPSLQKELNFSLSAVYVHHGLSPNAQSWADFCQRFCHNLNIPFRVAHVQLNPQSALGIEGEARAKRYAAYQESQATIIALAQHKDDQVETVILQFLRGGGVSALSGMPILREEKQKFIWRPLLTISKQQLIDFAKDHQISFIEDESNTDENYRRNWIRHTLLPTIQKAIPQAQSHILRTSSLMQENALLAEEVTSSDLNDIIKSGYFDLNNWNNLSHIRKKLSLLRYVQEKNMGTPRPDSIENFTTQLIAKNTRELCWQLPNGKVYAYQGKLYLSYHELFAFTQILIHDIHPIQFTNGEIIWRQHKDGIPLSTIHQGVILAPRQNGDKIKVGNFHKSIKSCLQEANIPPFLRKTWPMITSSQTNECLAIVNIRTATSQAKIGEPKYFPVWKELYQEFID